MFLASEAEKAYSKKYELIQNEDGDDANDDDDDGDVDKDDSTKIPCETAQGKQTSLSAKKRKCHDMTEEECRDER
jgi:hypothetical protein